MTAQPAHGPESWLDRLEEVRETGDRSATAALVELLLTDGPATPRLERPPLERPPLERPPLEDGVLEDVADALCGLEDPRCERPLEAALLDTARPRIVRAAALRVLSCLPTDDPSPVRVAAWLDDRDGLVRAHAASFLGPRDEARLAVLVHDPVVEVRRAVTEALVGATRTPQLVETLRCALRDPDPVVRETACRAALFDEPVAVTYDLLHLLDDDDGDVRCGAYDALEDYPCASVLLALADARSGPDGMLAAVTLELLVARVGAALATASGAGVRRILRWATPARWLLEEEWEALRDAHPGAPDAGPKDAGTGVAGLQQSAGGPEPSGESERAGVPSDPASVGDSERPPPERPPVDRPPVERPPVDMGAARQVLLDHDASGTRQRDLLVARHWGASGPGGLGLLVDVATSPLWSLRHGVAVALLDLVRSGLAGASDALLRLADDVEPVVRRIALHALTHAGDPRAVGPAQVTLADDVARPLAGDAALQAVAHLAPADVAERCILDELRGGNDRDGVRLGAVHLAERLRIASAVPALASVVAGEIVSGPSVHLAALHALRSLEAAPSTVALAHLESVDHLDVQAELGAWDWHGPRYG